MPHKRIGISWTAVFTVILGLMVNSSVVRQAGVLFLAPQSNGTDIASDYLKTQLRKTHLSLVDEAAGIQVVSNGPRSGNPLIMARETPFTLTGRGEPDLIVGATVALNTFSHVCPKPILGRALQAGDESPRHRIVLLSERLWRRRFDSDPALIGKTITLNKHAYTVIGIMPADFWFPYRSDPVELWIPAKTAPDRDLLIT
ncbi:MAG: ABC transporter permease [Candidatus Acidiferrales bacterium]